MGENKVQKERKNSFFSVLFSLLLTQSVPQGMAVRNRSPHHVFLFRERLLSVNPCGRLCTTYRDVTTTTTTTKRESCVRYTESLFSSLLLPFSSLAVFFSDESYDASLRIDCEQKNGTKQESREVGCLKIGPGYVYILRGKNRHFS